MPLICRRCLLIEMEDQRALADLMREWLEAIPDEQRADERIYRARLDACRACDELMNGLCSQCGCYVELRTAKARLGCPHPMPRWQPHNLG